MEGGIYRGERKREKGRKVRERWKEEYREGRERK